LVCGKLLVVPRCSNAQGLWHKRCQIALRQSPEYAAWLRRRWELRRAGLTARQIAQKLPPFRPPARTGRKPELDRNFGWTVRHLLGGETTAALAREFHVARPVVSRAIDAIMNLLPEPDIADHRTRRYVVALRQAQADQQAKKATA
jgi:hypothetical protein